MSTRHTCPQCGHKKEFTLYVDERNVPIDESCGRCNRERCGYHLTPSEYFKEHPTNDRTGSSTWKQPEPPQSYTSGLLTIFTFDSRHSSDQ